MSAERWVWTNVPDVNWKRVPSGRSSNCEQNISEACSCSPHREVAACWWSDTAVTAATANIVLMQFYKLNSFCLKKMRNRVWSVSRLEYCYYALAPNAGALSDAFVWRLTSVSLSVAFIGPKSKTERSRKTKIGTEIAHVTRDSDPTFKVKRSKIKVTRPLYSARP